MARKRIYKDHAARQRAYRKRVARLLRKGRELAEIQKLPLAARLEAVKKSLSK